MCILWTMFWWCEGDGDANNDDYGGGRGRYRVIHQVSSFCIWMEEFKAVCYSSFLPQLQAHAKCHRPTSSHHHIVINIGCWFLYFFLAAEVCISSGYSRHYTKSLKWRRIGFFLHINENEDALMLPRIRHHTKQHYSKKCENIMSG